MTVHSDFQRNASPMYLSSHPRDWNALFWEAQNLVVDLLREDYALNKLRTNLPQDYQTLIKDLDFYYAAACATLLLAQREEKNAFLCFPQDPKVLEIIKGHEKTQFWQAYKTITSMIKTACKPRDAELYYPKGQEAVATMG